MPRKEKSIHYLYKTTCKVTGRYYIGMHSTSNLEDGYLGSGKRLRYSIRKHGEDNHEKEILEFFDSRELLVEAEKSAITPDMLIDTMCMNLRGGGEGGFINLLASTKGGKNSIKKMLYDKWIVNGVENRKKLANANKKRWKDEKHKIKILKNLDWNNKKHSEYTRKIMSDKGKLRTGENNSQYGTCWITKDGKNKKIKKELLNNYLEDGWLKGRK